MWMQFRTFSMQTLTKLKELKWDYVIYTSEPIVYKNRHRAEFDIVVDFKHSNKNIIFVSIIIHKQQTKLLFSWYTICFC